MTTRNKAARHNARKETSRPAPATFTICGWELRLACGLFLFIFGGATLYAQSPVPAHKPAKYPDWWFQRNVIAYQGAANVSPDYSRPGDYSTPSDYTHLTVGQLKTFATAAYDELQAHGGASASIAALVKSWFILNATTHDFQLDTNGQRQELVTPTTADYAAANLGQLKAVTKPFYDQFIAAGLLGAYPWGNSSTPANNGAVANLGQAKFLFSFDPAAADPLYPAFRAWAAASGLDPTTPAGGESGDPESDGLTNLEEFKLGTKPHANDHPAVKLTAFGFSSP